MKKKGGGRVVHAAGGFVGMGGGAPRVDCLIFLRSIYYVSDCITWPRQHLNSHSFFFFSKNTYENKEWPGERKVERQDPFCGWARKGEEEEKIP